MLGDEQVDPGLLGQVGGPGPLGAALGRDPAGELAQVLDGVHAEVADPLHQPVQHVDGGLRRRSARGGWAWSRSGSAWASVASRQLGTSSRSRICPRQGRGVQHRPASGTGSPAPRRPDGGSRCRRARCGRRSRVFSAKARNAGSTCRSGGASATMALVMPVSTAISGGMCALRVDQGLELAEHLAAAHLDRAELGDRVRLRAAGGLQVDDAERHLGQVGAEVVEGVLEASRRPASVRRIMCETVDVASDSAGRHSLFAARWGLDLPSSPATKSVSAPSSVQIEPALRSRPLATGSLTPIFAGRWLPDLGLRADGVQGVGRLGLVAWCAIRRAVVSNEHERW